MRKRRKGLSEVLGSFIMVIVILSLTTSAVQIIENYSKKTQYEASVYLKKMTEIINPPLMSVSLENGSLVLHVYGDDLQGSRILIYYINNKTITYKKYNKTIIIENKYKCEPLKIMLILKSGAMIPYNALHDPLLSNTRIKENPSIITCNLFNLTNKNKLIYYYSIQGINPLAGNKLYFLTNKNKYNIKDYKYNKSLNIIIKTDINNYINSKTIGRLKIYINNILKTYIPPQGGEKPIYVLPDGSQLIIGSIILNKESIIYMKVIKKNNTFIMISGNASLTLSAYASQSGIAKTSGYVWDTLINLPFGPGINSSISYTFVKKEYFSTTSYTTININENSLIQFNNTPLIILAYASQKTLFKLNISINLNINKIIEVQMNPVIVPLGEFQGPLKLNLTTPLADAGYPARSLYDIAGTRLDPFNIKIKAYKNNTLVGEWRLLRGDNLTLFLPEKTLLYISYMLPPFNWPNIIYNLITKTKTIYSSTQTTTLVSISGSTVSYQYQPPPWKLPYKVNINNITLIIAPSAPQFKTGDRILDPIDAILPFEKLIQPKSLLIFPVKSLDPPIYPLPGSINSPEYNNYVTISSPVSATKINSLIGSNIALLCYSLNSECNIVYLNS